MVIGSRILGRYRHILESNQGGYIPPPMVLSVEPNDGVALKLKKLFLCEDNQLSKLYCTTRKVGDRENNDKGDWQSTRSYNAY